jgi:hypothetical protein
LYFRNNLTPLNSFVFQTSCLRTVHVSPYTALTLILLTTTTVAPPRKIRWVGHVACTGERKDGYRVVVGRPEAQRPRLRPRHKCKDNIKTYCKEVGWEA